MIRHPPRSTLFPYPTLSRSASDEDRRAVADDHLVVVRDERADLQVQRVAPHRTCARDQCQVDRKSTRLNSSHLVISYAVFCLKKKKKLNRQTLPNTKMRTCT